MSEETIVRNCSPTLAGMKTGSLFNCTYHSQTELNQSLRRWNRELAPKGIRVLLFREHRGRALVYLYRPCQLTADLSNATAQQVLRSRGYADISMKGALRQMVLRLRRESEFPHEIGLFLGYPPEDVRQFIENKAQNFKTVGCWKVYGDEEAARKTFAKFKKCTDVYSRLQAKGISVVRLTVAT